jgi:hypothetical protein
MSLVLPLLISCLRLPWINDVQASEQVSSILRWAATDPQTNVRGDLAKNPNHSLCRL